MANRDLTPWTRATGLTSFGGRDPFMNFRREMDRLFDDFFTPAETRSFAAGQSPTQTLGAWPRIDAQEGEQAYTITAEVPGMDPKDVQLDLRENALIISGEKRAERSDEGQGRRYSERSYGRFERVIPFESEVDSDRVEATCSNGVLTITLPKAAQARDRSRRIEIRPQGEGGDRSQSGQGQSGEGGAASGSGAV